MNYRQLTLDERYQLQVLRGQGLRPADIAKLLRRHPSTISREFRRNTQGSLRYTAHSAQKLCRSRRIEKGRRSRKIQGEVQELIEAKLRQSWSPEQIAGRLRHEKGISITHETIYQHVLRDCRQKGPLRYCLRFGGYKHHRFKKTRMAGRTRQRKNWIDQRGAAANERREVGHWERDCVLGKRGGAALVTLVDRKSRYTRIRRVEKLDTDQVATATIRALAAERVKTITNDNGVEFQRDQSLQDRLGVPIYFTDPSSPWQRGSIENLNGLVRQYLPKGTDMSKLPEWTGEALEDTLNFRPRKTLGFLTPHEVHYAEQLSLISNQRIRFGLELIRAT